MGDDAQMTMDLGVPVERTEWGKWVDPDRRHAQAQKFMDYAGIDRIPSKLWKKGSAEVKRLNPIVAELFPNIDAAAANIDMTDAFICFIGECFIKFAGGRWVDAEWADLNLSLYEHVRPAVACDTFDEDELVMWGEVEDMIGSPRRDDYEGMFSYIVWVLSEYAEDHEEKRCEDSEVAENRAKLKR